MTEFLGTEDKIMQSEIQARPNFWEQKIRSSKRQAQRAFEIKRLSMKQTIKPIA
jgi:hypothetical protein